MNVLRVEHESLDEALLFTDDELVDVDVEEPVADLEQESQFNNLSPVFIGDPRFEFLFTFNIFAQRTLEKLGTIYNIRATFTCFPFFLEEPLTSFTVFWSPETPLRERWHRGRRRAQWDHQVMWKESRLVDCIVEGS